MGCNLCAGLLVLLFAGAASRRQALGILSVLLVTVMIYWVAVPNWSQGMMLFGVFRQTNTNTKPPASYEEFVNEVTPAKSFYYKEGTMATIGVIEANPYNEIQKLLIVNGKPDASSKGDLPTQVLCGQLSCLLHKNPQNALVVGLGSGVTVGSILTHPVKRVDCVEIIPEMVEAASYFNDVNRCPLSDPRTSLFIEDALAYLKVTPRMYDVIVNEPTNPWIAGVGNLFTTEFFEACKRRMNPGGLMVQWFHMYEMNDDLFKMVVRTFQSSFAYVSMWQPLNIDVIMVGSDQPLSIDYDKIQTDMAVKEIHEDMQRILIPDAATLLSLEMLSPKSVWRYAGAGDLNTEDHPRLEYGAPGAFFVNTGVLQLGRYDERMRCDSVALQLKKRMENKQVTDEELRNIGFFHTYLNHGNILFGFSVLRDLQMRHPKDIKLLERLTSVAERLNFYEEALMYRKILVELQPTEPKSLEKYAWLKYNLERQRSTILSPIDMKESEDMLYKSIKLVDDTIDLYRFRLGDIYYGTQRFLKATDQYARTIQIRGTYRNDPTIQDDMVFLQLARCFNQLDKNDRAFGYAMQAVNSNPRNIEARDLVYEIWMKGSYMPKPK
jgi:spermidine synthase